MPQGLQVFDSGGTLVVDTSTYILKEFAVYNVPLDGSNSYVSLPPLPPASTVIANVNTAGAAYEATVDVDVSLGRINYKTVDTFDGRYGEIRAMAF